MLLIRAEEDLERKRKIHLYNMHQYLDASQIDPLAEETLRLDALLKKSVVLVQDAEENLRVLASSVCIPPVSKPLEDKPHQFVPRDLPFLQLEADACREKPHRVAFSTVYDFCQEFTTIIEAHSLSMNANWERLMFKCLGKVDRVWFQDKIKGKNLTWKQAESKILDRFDPPFRKFLRMSRLWSIKQQEGETVRSFSLRFDQLRQQSQMKDGTELALCFWSNLLPTVQTTCLAPLSKKFGNNIPTKLDEIIDLVSAASDDSSTFVISSRSNREKKAIKTWNSLTNGVSPLSSSGSSSGTHMGKKRPFEQEKERKGKRFSYDRPTSRKSQKTGTCKYCSATWSRNHASCSSSFEENESSTYKPYLSKISRMASRSENGTPVVASGRTAGVVRDAGNTFVFASGDDNGENKHLARMA